MNKNALIVVIVILALILAAGLGFIVYKSLSGPTPVEPTADSLPEETQQTPVEDVALPEQTTQEAPEETTEEPTTTAPEVAVDEDNNEWGALPPSDTQPIIPETPTTEVTEPTQPATTAPAPTEDDAVGELPGLGENDTPWN